MDKQPQSRAPLIVAIVLLVLPVLYVGSYLALVSPEGRYFPSTNKVRWDAVYYRLDSKLCVLAFWPLEKIDRKVRPDAWGLIVSEEIRERARQRALRVWQDSYAPPVSP